jgi:hypothetical protein
VGGCLSTKALKRLAGVSGLFNFSTSLSKLVLGDYWRIICNDPVWGDVFQQKP